jgi:hypothetical protein
MYNLAKELVGQVHPSPSQTSDGEAFWQGKQVWEESLEYKHMDPEFAAKAVTLLGLKGGKAYDDIKDLAIQMGQVREFRNLMNAANGMAFSEFDTNPGDFKNWWQFARDLFVKFAQ